MTSNYNEPVERPIRAAPPSVHKLTIEREPGHPLEIDPRKRTYVVLTFDGHWGRSNLSMSWAAWNALAAGACATDPGLAVTIIGDDGAFMEGDENISYAPGALNCGPVKVSNLGALLENVEEVSAWLKKGAPWPEAEPRLE